MPAVDLKAHLAAAARLFRVPTDPDLTRAQFDAFSKQIPLLYFILISSTIAVAYTYVNVAPD
jgi:predicted signal transduction protein with EAL and GGDEF domain